MQLKNLISDHKSAIESLENCNKSINLKYNETLKQNEKLEAQVEACNKRLNNLEKTAYWDKGQQLKRYGITISQNRTYNFVYIYSGTKTTKLKWRAIYMHTKSLRRTIKIS